MQVPNTIPYNENHGLTTGSPVENSHAEAAEPVAKTTAKPVKTTHDKINNNIKLINHGTIRAAALILIIIGTFAFVWREKNS